MKYNAATLDYINSTIENYLPQTMFPASIYDSVRYSLLGEGKRIRPYLMIEACELAGGDLKFIEPLFSALEMIHTYSLIHDDLPCMDNDDERRGKPTNHVVFGYSTAVLAGDALLNLAYETMFTGYETAIHKTNYIKACGIISENAGIKGMISGQVADMSFDETSKDKEALSFIYRKKTGALIKASLLAGALSSEIEPEKFSAIGKYADSLGLLFQLTDDVLDMRDGEPEKGKMTYGSVYGYKYTLDLINEECQKAKQALQIFNEKSRSLSDFAERISKRSK